MNAQMQDLANGGLSEKLNDELLRVVQNICDPNTEAKKKREISLKIIFAPNLERTSCVVDIQCVSKLAPSAPLTTGLLVGVDPRTGEIEAIEPRQGALFTDQSEVAKLTTYRKTKEV